MRNQFSSLMRFDRIQVIHLTLEQCFVELLPPLIYSIAEFPRDYVKVTF